MGPDEVTLREFGEQVDRGEWFVLDDVDTGRLAATVRVLQADEELWGARPPTALHVHGLRDGRSSVRLDCVETNAACVTTT